MNVIAKTTMPLAVIVAGLAGTVFVSDFLRDRRPALPESYSDSDLSMKGGKLKGFALGMEGLIADWYYIRALQYIGNKMIESKEPRVDIENLSDLNPRLLYPFLDSATDLDPNYIGAYLYGAIVLPAVDKEKAIALAKKGIENNPTEWRIHQYLGFIYWKLGDYEKAAETYQRGSEIPGSSSFMRLMAAAMRTEGGSRETARSIYRQMLEESTDEAVRITAERRLAQIEWFDEREAIDAVLADFKARNGRCASAFGEVFPALLLKPLPDGRKFRVDGSNRLADPSGAAYRLDREQCVVALDYEKTKLPAEK